MKVTRDPRRFIWRPGELQRVDTPPTSRNALEPEAGPSSKAVKEGKA